jgi:thiol:disulfide interchange protein DsbC
MSHVLFLILFSFNFTVFAQKDAISEKVKIDIKKAVEELLDNRYKVDSILRTPMKNILEVRVGNELVYIDKTASFLFIEGQMINLKSGENLTDIRKQEIFKINFSDLPLDLAIKTQFGKIKENTNRVLVVFEDPYCSYCRKLRITLGEMKNLTVYTFLYPILGEKSIETSKSILCSKDSALAWENLMLDGIKPIKYKSDCSFDIEKLLNLGKKYNIDATPTIYLSNGKRFSGAVSSISLNKELIKLN